MLKRIGALVVCLLLVALPAHAKLSLTSTSDIIQVITASGVSTIHVHADWADITSSAVTGGNTSTLITTATTTTVVAAPAASTTRQIKGLTIFNSHASSSNGITIQHYNGTTTAIFFRYTLLAGEQITINEDGNVITFDANGFVRTLSSIKTPAGGSPWDETNIALKVSPVTVAAVSGNVAHGTADTPQSPVKIGCQVTSSMAGETLEADADMTHCYAGRDGAILMRPEASLEDITYLVATATTGGNTQLIAAAGAGIKTCIKQLRVNAIGTTSSNYAILTDGSGGTTKDYLVYPSGVGATYQYALPLCSTANTAWYVDSQGSETLLFAVGYFKSQE